MALTSQAETTELVKTALHSLENEAENELAHNASNLVADRTGSEMIFEVGWCHTRSVVTQACFCISQVQILSAEESDDVRRRIHSPSALSC